MTDSIHEPIPAVADDADASRRVYFLLWVLAAATLCGLLLSPNLWLSSRTYPLTPVWDRLPTIPHPWDWLWFGVLLALLGASVAAPRPSLPILAFLVLAGLLSLWDQTRWQPWWYQYLFLFATLGFALRRPEEPGRRQAGLDGCRLIVASIYVWSGLQKINVSFADIVHPYLMEPLLRLLPESWRAVVQQAGWYVGLVETGIGLSLLVWPLCYPAVVLAVGMHTVILASLGPWGHNWNSVVWPWNLAMMLFVVILFWRRRPTASWRIFWPQRLCITRLTLLLFGVLPLLSFFGLWDAYLSAALYSGNTLQGEVYIDAQTWNALPPAVQERHTAWAGDEEYLPGPAYSVDLANWAFQELNVPPYPARRVYRSLARSLARKAGSTDVFLIIEEPPDWQTGKRARTPELLKPD